MRVSTISILPLAALASGFVIPDESISQQLVIEDNRPIAEKIWDTVPSRQGFKTIIDDTIVAGHNAFDKAVELASETSETVNKKMQCYKSMTAFDTKGWMESAQSAFDMDETLEHHGKSQHPHKPHTPHHGHGHGKPNLTIYELISKSKYTTKLAKLIDEYPNIVKTLNGTVANYTLVCPYCSTHVSSSVYHTLT
jgi:hypothetical protein